MKKIIISIFMMVFAMTVSAETYEYLTFVTSSGTEISYSVDGIKVTFSNGTAIITNDGTTSGTHALSGLNYMYFGGEGGDTPTTTTVGDVNNDGEVNIADVNALISIILGNSTEDDYEGECDVNGDDEINIADVNAVIAIILGDS